MNIRADQFFLNQMTLLYYFFMSLKTCLICYIVAKINLIKYLSVPLYMEGCAFDEGICI